MLSKSQKRAIGKLTREWKSSYEIQESRTVLDSLVAKGLVEVMMDLGSIAFPRINIKYRLLKNR
jgi:hypothetical protein